MDLKDIAAVSGKSGLYKVLKPTRNGVILESIDEQKTKFIANANTRVSLLKEISIYTDGKEASLPLEDVFSRIFEKYGKTIDVSGKSTPVELQKFVESVVPDYDKEKVYQSDMKKLVVWYTTISTYFPERFTAASSSETASAETSETNEEAEPLKAAKPKAKAAKEKVADKEEKEAKPKAKAAAKKS
ncbi:MAG: DUF5606 domain-containing protein [Sporocytophaga sp.]|uniref:DUF5606 family protein n=1 Tax=Sporocytophaga sp. TaxID=2231183 RepID=UPI001B1D96D0|nr:DUF5606 domain-containing protein [Sporocytophaga sp.]MBO9699187.1 DUF5606 domain-containing protein [Sporocytophaga sp.]